MKKIALLVLLLMIFALGCEDGGEDGPVTSPAFLGGDKGIVATFEPMGIVGDGGEEEIWDGETFPIEVTLRNKGEKNLDSNEATITLMGIDLSDFSGITNNGVLSNSQSIEKISEYNRRGGEITLDFTPGSTDARYNNDIVGSSYEVSVFAKVEYYYETYASVPKVCFKEDLNDPSVCEVEEEKTVYSSGAPIRVTRVTEKSAGTGKVAVEFEIQNVGGGRVTKPNTPFDSRFDQLTYEVSEQNEWECKSGGKINEARLSDDRALIRCVLRNPLAANILYVKQMDLTLKYDYKDLIQGTVKIKKQ
jgi:hypothetical protein